MPEEVSANEQFDLGSGSMEGFATLTVSPTPDSRRFKFAVAGKTGLVSAAVDFGYIPEAADPSDIQDYIFDFTNLLGTAETIDSYTLLVDPVAIGLGVQFMAPEYPSEVIDGGKAVRFWLSVSAQNQSHQQFTQKTGVNVAVSAWIMTSNDPQRRIQRTGVINMRQR